MELELEIIRDSSTVATRPEDDETSEQCLAKLEVEAI